MPDKKVLTILIICFGLVVSVWLMSDKIGQKATQVAKKDSVSAEPAILTNENTNADWKKMLTAVDSKSVNFTDLTKNVALPEDDTITDQISRDILTQYMLSAKNGVSVTPEVAKNIADMTLTMPQYKSESVVYLVENLNIVKNDTEILKKYKTSLNQAIMPVYYDISNDPMEIMLVAIQTDSEKDIKKLDPIIKINEDLVKNLKNMPVPEKLTVLHLNLLNESSAILHVLKSMRTVVTDPIKGFTVLGEYPNHLNAFKEDVIKIDQLLKKSNI